MWIKIKDKRNLERREDLSMNLFIDTNIYLTFYGFTSEALEELKKLDIAVKSGKINLYVPEQVQHEFKRGRERAIANSIKRFNEIKLPNEFPQLCKGYGEYEELRKNLHGFNKFKEMLTKKIFADVENNNLEADRIIWGLFAKAQIIADTPAIINEAKVRFDRGNPPGKDKSYGDAIIWESLLGEIPEEEDLYFVTDDKDYLSPVDKESLNNFLFEEWKQKKNSEIKFYKKLTGFFKENYPDIKLASELEKQFAISDFVNSGTFQNTHLTIEKLSKFSDFSDAQINEIVEASITNTQIIWIRDDEDVKPFLTNIIKGREHIIDPQNFREFKEIYFAAPENELANTDEIPF